MYNDETLLALEKIISKKEINDLKNIVIFQENDGSYNVYDKYKIYKNKDGIYKVEVLGTYTVKDFYKLKNALAWCGFDKRILVKKAKRLHQLDQMIFSMDTEIQLHTRLIKRTKEEDSLVIYLAKLSQNKAKKRNYGLELSAYINEYTSWQNSLFDTKPNY